MSYSENQEIGQLWLWWVLICNMNYIKKTDSRSTLEAWEVKSNASDQSPRESKSQTLPNLEAGYIGWFQCNILLTINKIFNWTQFWQEVSVLIVMQWWHVGLLVSCELLCWLSNGLMWNDYFQVDPHGIAGIDGRIREGDQILQVFTHSVIYERSTVNILSRNTISTCIPQSLMLLNLTLKQNWCFPSLFWYSTTTVTHYSSSLACHWLFSLLLLIWNCCLLQCPTVLCK